MEDLSRWPEHWRRGIASMVAREQHFAREHALQAEARRAPLHRLRYRWSLRRRAPAWKQRRLKGWRWACDRCGAVNTMPWPHPCVECGETQWRRSHEAAA